MPLARFIALSLLTATMLSGCASLDNDAGHSLTLSILATNDVHGELQADDNRGGLVSVSGYVNALRSAQGPENVLLIDAGDMWQGSIESNLNEGAAVVQAYNAMDYAAAAIGNHEFDFGPVGSRVTAAEPGDDPRGALKQRASEARFPLLAANIFDASTDRMVDWDNVRASTVVNAGGISVGIIGVVTSSTPRTTIAANLDGLHIASLAETIRREAQELRKNGVPLVIVAAHAGGYCTDFSDPEDLSSCDKESEIFEIANSLPTGLVDHIFAGHIHEGIAHIVNGISITSGYSHTYAFSRVDFRVNSRTGETSRARIFRPQIACPFRRRDNDQCAWQPAPDVAPAVYDGYIIRADAAVAAIAEQAATSARERKLKKIGAYLETPFTLKGNPESALGNLMTDAMLESIDGDIAIHNVSGGIRGILPAGELTFGALYEMFPFDNRVVVISMSGRDLRTLIAEQARLTHRRAGISGMRVRAECVGNRLHVEMRLANGKLIADADTVRVIVNDFLALGGDGILTPAMPDGGFQYDEHLPLARDVLAEWFASRSRLHAEEFLTGDQPKWLVPAEIPENCTLPGT